MKTVWVLTRGVNDYNQYGEYFEDVFKEKPTLDQLKDAGLWHDDAEKCIAEGGGRIGHFDVWWNLSEVELK